MIDLDTMARHVRDALTDSEELENGDNVMPAHHARRLLADFEAWDEADDAKVGRVDAILHGAEGMAEARKHGADSFDGIDLAAAAPKAADTAIAAGALGRVSDQTWPECLDPNASHNRRPRGEQQVFDGWSQDDYEGMAAFANGKEPAAPKAASEDYDAAERSADEAVDFVFDRLASKLGLAEWQVVEGSEEWEGDVSATLHRLLIDAGIIDDETGTVATLNPKAASEDGATGLLREALVEAREMILELIHAHDCQYEGTDEQAIGFIDAALAASPIDATGAEKMRERCAAYIEGKGGVIPGATVFIPVITGDRMPTMSGDGRDKLNPHKRRCFDDATRDLAAAIRNLPVAGETL